MFLESVHDDPRHFSMQANLDGPCFAAPAKPGAESDRQEWRPVQPHGGRAGVVRKRPPEWQKSRVLPRWFLGSPPASGQHAFVARIGQQLDRSIDLVAGRGPADRQPHRSADLRIVASHTFQGLGELIRGGARLGARDRQLTSESLDLAGARRQLNGDRIGESRGAGAEDFRRGTEW